MLLIKINFISVASSSRSSRACCRRSLIYLEQTDSLDTRDNHGNDFVLSRWLRRFGELAIWQTGELANEHDKDRQSRKSYRSTAEKKIIVFAGARRIF